MNWVKEKITVPLSFLKNRNGNDSIEDLVPLAAKSGELWFWLKTNEIIGCDLETMKITATVSADAERDNTRVPILPWPSRPGNSERNAIIPLMIATAMSNTGLPLAHFPEIEQKMRFMIFMLRT
ncbi:hypothetical protein OIU77_009537 [Salix suchowensis]|uniref:Uncharacterized protein n=1 Tax=Salix suchowensis TaxID=1278906 RepID=A0ABQ9AGW8_9ROSI|nr:hypothetical protein OIU77_009537 [Salix suchowensis]